MRAVVFINGHISDYTRTAHWLHGDDFLIGADGGTRHCLALGRRPHAVVGDLDSLEPEAVARLAGEGVVIERHPPAKDKTDLELAVEYAIRHGATELLLLGALGGRLDQTLANLLLLARADWPIPIKLAEENQLAQIMRDDDYLVLDAPVGSTLSVLALSEQVTGITYTGLQYPLIDFTLTIGSARGVSNVVVKTPATIRIGSGVLLVVQSFLSEML